MCLRSPLVTYQIVRESDVPIEKLVEGRCDASFESKGIGPKVCTVASERE